MYDPPPPPRHELNVVRFVACRTLVVLLLEDKLGVGCFDDDVDFF